MSIKTVLAVMACSGLQVASAANDSQPGIGTGKRDFDARCAKCHVEGGTGTFMLGRRLGKEKALLAARDDLRNEYIRYVVRNGMNSMPWLTRVEVTDAELDAIVNYLTRPR